MFEAIDLRKCDFSDTIPQIFFPLIGITGKRKLDENEIDVENFVK